MPRTLNVYEAARVTGMKAAQEEHRRLGTSMRERVAVFDVIEDARIWLFFQPMRSLYGAYERRGEAAGIIINSQHPLSLQRFTAGHEYGHHVLGHKASADDEERIYRGDRQNMQEVAAQAFAGEFLMPVQLLNYTFRTIGFTGQHPALSPREIYRLALDLGVSYAAAVTQLVGQRKLMGCRSAALLSRDGPGVCAGSAPSWEEPVGVGGCCLRVEAHGAVGAYDGWRAFGVRLSPSVVLPGASGERQGGW